MKQRNCAGLLRTFVCLVLAIGFCSRLARAGDIDSCKYLVVTDFTADPYGIAQELRTQARSKGFTLISSVTDAAQSERLKTCVMAGSWNREAYGGNVAVRVVDAVSGDMVGEAAASGTAWWSAKRTVHGVVKKLYSQLGYTGYSEAVFRERMQRLYPTRPELAISEAQIRSTEPRSNLEGIWSDPQNEYRLGIVKAPEGATADYVAVILQSSSPVWKPGEIKAEIRSTASPSVFTSTYFMGNKRPSGTTLSLEHDSVLRGSISTPSGPFELVLLRVWPKAAAEPVKTASAEDGKSGTGFLLTRGGLIATNWHVVSDSKRIGVAFAGWKDSVNAEVVVRDFANVWQYFGSQMREGWQTYAVSYRFNWHQLRTSRWESGSRRLVIPSVRYLDQTQNSQREQSRARAACRTILVGSRFQPRFSPDRAVVHCSMNTETS